uniref:hypothetical protein n=1 Tax=Streptosporangium sp. CA-235898 TaxID=3240073 RepID=UPI003F49A2CE
MTVIAGLVHDGRVYMGGDSAGCAGWELTVRRDPKVFEVGPYLIGFTTSFRMGQLLRFSFTPPTLPYDLDHDGLTKLMVTEFIDGIRATFKDGGYARKDSEQESGGKFLVGVRGRLFEIGPDYQVGEPADSYAAVGCGAQVALGALHAMNTMDTMDDNSIRPMDRIHHALYAAERFSNGVRAPFTVIFGEPATDDSEPA